MQNRVEPPILLSRILTFVLATASVVLVVMGITLYKMFPLNRPQVFFLLSSPSHTQSVTLRDMQPESVNLDGYKRAFVKEYIKARNEIAPNINIMRQKWRNEPSAVVRTWSNDNVFKDFKQTRMWTALMNEAPEFELECPVEFEQGAITTRGNDMYAVKFRWFCKNSDGQVDAKDYTIVIKLESDEDLAVKWTDRLNNPLGIRVSQYTVESVDGDKSNNTDPLNRF
ncbi:MAG: hypothetical protein IKV10_01780 [Alphaproteobacteria bacterium]|nr:hypothetical protein [Alphaproteobacteria bacterium]